ncbi:TrbC family F-type conjugative pilus assembly protein [Acidithiobacillus sp.]|uniref:TrbC family F-type conjugative pilus assembly protein n=1 Tax=Acidithiobacillus sp. TaxID=1872118 RepID=UPI0026376C7C|nr:TrbC family F-type conjugative pilus assembly protein [Acidithiobacillus sp.]MDD5280829.1 TrbC family F-type conjugative pilus assembly protein [Acidithiobacillus sp.]
MITPPINMAQVQSIVRRSDGIMRSAGKQSAPDWETHGVQLSAQDTPTQKTFMQPAKNDLEQYAAEYAAESNAQAQEFLRKRVNGVPVIPANLHGKALQEYVDHTLMKKEEMQAKTLVFISMNMPHSILRKWFKVVADNKKLFENTVFVLRGWPNKPEGLPDMISQVNGLMPSYKKTANVEINPIQFTDHHVNLAPVIIHEAPDGKWGAIVGDGDGLRGAIKAINHGKGNPHKIHGQTWKIAEPNMISIFEKKIKTFNWQKAEAQAKDRDWQEVRSRIGDKLPDSSNGRHYTYNPSIIATATIRLPSGKILVHKGQTLDPLTAMPFGWSQSYIVFNPAQAWQVAQVEAWESIYPNVVIMASQLPDSWQAENTLVERLKHPVYGITPHLAQRLGINRVPALIRPDGNVLSITVTKEPLEREK